MSLFSQLALIICGGAAVWLGAEFLVRGASRLAKAFGVSEFIVGATVVAFGTSAPEWIVSIMAQLDDKAAISLGNVIGSNVANIALGMGLTGLVVPIAIQTRLLKNEVLIVLLAEMAFLWMCLDRALDLTDGIILLGGFLAVYAWILLFAKRRSPGEEEDTEGKSERYLHDTGLTLLGLALLLAGAHYFVVGAEAFALKIGMSRETVGLTIVAIGTSLPELGTSFVAAARGRGALSIGNLLGSNLFNVLLVGGSLATISRVEVAPSLDVDIWWMIGVTAILFPLALLGKRDGGVRRLGRWAGVLLTGAYVFYLGSKLI